MKRRYALFTSIALAAPNAPHVASAQELKPSTLTNEICLGEACSTKAILDAQKVCSKKSVEARVDIRINRSLQPGTEQRAGLLTMLSFIPGQKPNMTRLSTIKGQSVEEATAIVKEAGFTPIEQDTFSTLPGPKKPAPDILSQKTVVQYLTADVPLSVPANNPTIVAEIMYPPCPTKRSGQVLSGQIGSIIILGASS